MKKITALMLVLVFAFAIVGCNAEPAHDHAHDHESEVSSKAEATINPITKAVEFSYKKEKAEYAKDKEGVKTEGFKNTEKAAFTTIPDAIALAKNECTVKYDSVNVFYDAKAEICKVHFYTEGQVGGDQMIYIDKDGKTVLIVSGE